MQGGGLHKPASTPLTASPLTPPHSTHKHAHCSGHSDSLPLNMLFPPTRCQPCTCFWVHFYLSSISGQRFHPLKSCHIPLGKTVAPQGLIMSSCLGKPCSPFPCYSINHESVRAKSLQSCPTPQTVAHQAPLSMGILQARILKGVAMLSSSRSS